MKYSEEEQESLDIDWFFLDKKNRICHVASAGGRLPKFVSRDKEETSLLSMFFGNMEKSYTEVEINENIEKYVQLSNKEDIAKYLTDFISFAKKGIYSFDKSHLSKFNDNKYHLVANPKKNLKLNDIPLNISKILSKNRLNIDVEINDKFDLTEEINL